MEIWKDVEGYEGLYQVSNEGRVKSIDRVVEAFSRWGKKRLMHFKGEILKQCKGKNGYTHVLLSKNGERKTLDVHPLIWKTFNGEIPNDMQVNHIDEDKTNNKLDNLELLSPKDNTNYGTGIDRMKQAKRLRRKT